MVQNPRGIPDWWRDGELKLFSVAAGYYVSRVAGYLRRTSSPSFETAWHLDLTSLIMFDENRRIHWFEWLGNPATRHPAFRPLAPHEKFKLDKDTGKFVRATVESLKKIEYIKKVFDQPIVKQFMHQIPDFSIREARIDVWKTLQDVPAPTFNAKSQLTNEILTKLKTQLVEASSVQDVAEDIMQHQESLDDLLERYQTAFDDDEENTESEKDI